MIHQNTVFTAPITLPSTGDLDSKTTKPLFELLLIVVAPVSDDDDDDDDVVAASTHPFLANSPVVTKQPVRQSSTTNVFPA